MQIAPFTIKKLRLDSARMRVRAYPVGRRGGRSHSSAHSSAHSDGDDFPGYFVVSTAPPNIEEAKPSTAADVACAKQGIAAIARDLHRIQCDPTITEPAELVIAVHGYNTALMGVRAWYSDMYRYIAQDDKHIRHRRNLVFIGYRWSSERLSFRPKHLWKNLRALPDVPQTILGIGLAVILFSWGWTLLYGPLSDWLHWWWANLLVQFGLSLAITATVMILTLLALRLSSYFRDVYRAINFGVPDLTELIRQLDQAVVDLRVSEVHNTSHTHSEALRRASHQKTPQKIQLNFLGHSMGGLVITNVVRILSDVFDTRSIGRSPTPEIGHTLSLGRLILASPDIPVLSIISSRANGLASSLRRFNEAYLFSNEGDLALRLASTAVNYISFPSASQQHGHRLGSIALTNKIYKKGIINLQSLREHYPLKTPLNQAIKADPDDILNCLFITHSSGTGNGYLSLGNLFKIEHQTHMPATLADLFTFFDCTDYKDYKLELKPNGLRDRSKKEVGILTRAKCKKHLELWDYLELIWDSIAGNRDVHGGYFHGQDSRQLIYRLAFLGAEAGLISVAKEVAAQTGDDPLTMEAALDAFDQRCMEKGIQIYLSPLRYRVDVQGTDIYRAKCEMLRTMQTDQPPHSIEEPSTEESSVEKPTTQQSISLAS